MLQVFNWSVITFFVKKIFLCLILILTMFVATPVSTNASTVLFSDDFDDGLADGWSVPFNTCSTNWVIDNNRYGINITNPCRTETVPSSLMIPSAIDYSFEVDMTMINNFNMDRNFVFKYLNSQNWYGIHTIGNSLYLHKVVNGTEYFLTNWLTAYTFTSNSTYHFKVISSENSFKIYVNNVLIQTVPDQPPYFNNFTAGLQASAGGQPTSQVWFDNVTVTALDTSTSTPSPTPIITPSPTPIPTLPPTPSPTASPTPTIAPTPTPLVLNVPDIKQYSLPWKDQVYDSAQNWSSNPTIERWGCALTSASMILKYYGHNVTPEILNNWLRNQSDGYLANGLVNWLALSRYTKERDTIFSPSLEFLKVSPTNQNLDNELFQNRPVVLKLPGHFVVAKGKLPTTYLVNDPASSTKSDLTHFGNTYLGINTFIPSHTDLSYLMFTINPLFNIKLTDQNGNEILGNVEIEDPLIDDLSPSEDSGDSLKVFQFPKPGEDKYIVEVSGPNQKYELTSYMYDESGKVQKERIEGKLKNNKPDKIKINTSKKNKHKKNWHYHNWNLHQFFNSFPYFR